MGATDNVTSTGNSTGKCMNINQVTIMCLEGLHSVSQGYISFASVCLIIYSTVMILREAFQLVLFRREYLTSFTNYIEVPLFMLTIVFASVCSNECYGSHSWQWQTGVIAVFLSWIVLILSIRKLPVIGIYVVMFLRICYNFMKVFVLALLLILAFAVPFYMVFYDKVRYLHKSLLYSFNFCLYLFLILFLIVSFFLGYSVYHSVEDNGNNFNNGNRRT